MTARAPGSCSDHPSHAKGRLWARHWAPGAVGKLIGALVVAAALVSSEVTICPTAGLWGVPCPGCGLSRALVAALSGRFSQALGFHPLVVLVLPALAAAALVQGRQATVRRWVGTLSVVCLIALLGVWVLRFQGAWGGPVPVQAWGFIRH